MKKTLALTALLAAPLGCAHATEVDPPAPKTHVAFVTRAAYSADLARAAGVKDGLAAADAICSTTARAASRTGTFHAWLSSTSASAIDRIVGAGPWSLPGGGRVLDNRDQLATQPRVAFDRDENGDETFGQIWTGTAVGGHPDVTPGTCGDWTLKDDYGQATVGDTLSDDERWTQASQAPCSFPQHLLCIEEIPADE